MFANLAVFNTANTNRNIELLWKCKKCDMYLLSKKNAEFHDSKCAVIMKATKEEAGEIILPNYYHRSIYF